MAIVLGWREWVSLPALGFAAVRAKVDTGARSSALHVERQWRFVQDGAPWVGFCIRPSARQGAMEATAPVRDERDVRDSGGRLTRRVFICTPLRLAGVEHDIEINLADRRDMLFPLLLGRTALSGTFLVDPQRSFLHGRARRMRKTSKDTIDR